MEMMIVMIIIGMFITFAARKFTNKDTEVKTTIRRFSVLAKKLRDRARIENKTYRMVFDLPEDKRKQQSYWIESTDKKALLLNSEEREELVEQLEADEEQGTDGDAKEKPDPQGFVVDNSIIRQAPADLPRSLFFDSIELDGDPVERVKFGRVYIYFFPQGFVQGSAIHLTNREKSNWTVAIQAVTGRVNIYYEDIGLQEIKESK